LKLSINLEKNKMFIREATEDDLSNILNLQKELMKVEDAFNSFARSNTNYTKEDILEYIKNDSYYFLIAEENSKIIACGFCTTQEGKLWNMNEVIGYIGFMVTIPKFRGKGIGHKIIEKLIKYLEQLEIKEIELCVYPQNKDAIQFYEKANFKPFTLNMRRLKK
jgi:ribosomal-protein-alanine N-acetyltransferase